MSHSESSSKYKRNYAARTAEEKVAYLTRLPVSSYDAMMAAAAATSTSANTVVQEALEYYLSSPAFRARLGSARELQEEAINKLAGITPPLPKES